MKLSLLSLALPLSVVAATPCIYPISDACGDNQYCAIEDGKCALRIAMQVGTCAPKGAMACPFNFAPVCGCDLNTYSNTCLAAAAGVNVMTDGACDDVPAVAPAVAQECTYPDGPGGEECGDNQYCAVKDGKCALRIAMQPGTCAPKGTMACPMNMAPVCGCDMNTYDNSCLAGAAGVNVMAEGPCDAPVGGDYCTWSPDGACYLDEWPQCCLDEEQPCPSERQPRCDNHNTTGWDFCTYSPDTECYESGWPACCGQFDGTNCPMEQPSCDVSGMEATFPSGSKMDE